jgi:hypothetical protein
MAKSYDKNDLVWRRLGFRNCREPNDTWNWSKSLTEKRVFKILAPHGLAEFEQRHCTVYYQGKKIIEAHTQWEATWATVGYFYSKIVSTLPALTADWRKHGEADAIEEWNKRHNAEVTSRPSTGD